MSPKIGIDKEYMHFSLFLAEGILNQEIWILLLFMTFKTSLLVRKCSAIVLNEINLNVRLNYSQQSKSIEIFIALQHFLSNKMDIIIFEKPCEPENEIPQVWLFTEFGNIPGIT